MADKCLPKSQLSYSDMNLPMNRTESHHGNKIRTNEKGDRVLMSKVNQILVIFFFFFFIFSQKQFLCQSHHFCLG